MDSALRPLGLTVPQYACLELPGREPDLSNAELARGAFVTRQSMNGVLRRLQERGLVSRPALAPQGRALPSRLTPEGWQLLDSSAAAVRDVEERMLVSSPQQAQSQLLGDLTSCVRALTDVDTDDSM